MGGPNLEVFKFGVYIFFPIAMMAYFGSNLDEKFSVPGFWPTKQQSNRVPTERDELDDEIRRLRIIRLHMRQQRLEDEAMVKGDFDEVRRLRSQRLDAQTIPKPTSSKSSWWQIGSGGREG